MKNPNGGAFTLKLFEDANTYYQIVNTDGYGAEEVSKYVNGVQVDFAVFDNEYTQNITYPIIVTFSPDGTTVQAFGQTVTMNSNNSNILVSSFSIETIQQDACYDNIVYSIEGSTPPIADAGTPQSQQLQQPLQ